MVNCHFSSASTQGVEVSVDCALLGFSTTNYGAYLSSQPDFNLAEFQSPTGDFQDDGFSIGSGFGLFPVGIAFPLFKGQELLVSAAGPTTAQLYFDI